MAKKRICLGILVIVLVFGMTVVGCDDGSGNREPPASTLTVTNFSGVLTHNQWIDGSAYFHDGDEIHFYFSAGVPTSENNYAKGAKITGSSITLKVYFTDDRELFSLYTGNHTIEVGYLNLFDNDTEVYDDDVTNYVTYFNKVPITFTNGSATINFGTVMELVSY